MVKYSTGRCVWGRQPACAIVADSCLHRFCRNLRRRVQQTAQFSADPGKIQPPGVDSPFGHDHIIVAVGHKELHLPETFPDEPPHAVTPDSRPAFSGHGRPKAPGQGRFFPGNSKENKAGRKKTAALFVAMQKFGAAAQSVLAQGCPYTASLLRPLARLRRKISRPATVAMRALKPWVLLRLILLG